jgi:large subunit ribosomal protein L3
MSSLNGILGTKLGMTQIFDDQARSIPVTVVKAGPVHVVQIKTIQNDGYNAIQIAFGEAKPGKVNKPSAGHFAKAGVAPAQHLIEVKVDDPSQFTVGQEIKVEEMFEVGSRADVSGVSKGKGFSGVMKRHNFSGQGASHGNHKKHRAPGSIGACATPSRVFKGMRMAGRMGGEKVTTLSLEVAGVDAERGLLMLNGSVPGPKGSVVFVREAVKARG